MGEFLVTALETVQTGHQSNPGQHTEGDQAPREVMVAAYIVIDRLSVTDREQFAAYPDPATAAVRRYGGRYVLPEGTAIEALEGNWKPNRIVVIEFEDADLARQWWDSVEYAGARAIHHQATISNVILVGGTPC